MTVEYFLCAYPCTLAHICIATHICPLLMHNEQSLRYGSDVITSLQLVGIIFIFLVVDLNTHEHSTYSQA